MPIPSTTPANNQTTFDVPVYQDWAPIPSEVHIYKSINIPGITEPFNIEVKVKDGIGVYPQASSFRLVYIKQYIPQSLAWIKPFTYKESGVPDTIGQLHFITISENGMVLEYPVELINVNLLPLGVYKFRQTFSLQGKTLNQWNELSYIHHDTYLHIVDDLVFFNPKNLNYNHYYGTVPGTKTVQLNGVNWELIGHPHYVLTAEPGVAIVDIVGPNGTYQKAIGSGIKDIYITLSNIFNQPIPPGTIPLGISISMLTVKSGTTTVGYINCRVRTYYTDILELTPDELVFTAIKNINDAAPQNIIFVCSEEYVLTHSPWLTATVGMVVIDGAPTQVIEVWPMSSHNMDAGLYLGYVKVVATINGVEKIETTIIRYMVEDLMNIPYEFGQFAFTLDKKFINLLSFNSETYIQMNTIVKTFDFFTGLENDYVIPEKIGLFKGRAMVNIGKRIHQLLDKNKKINNNIFQYKPAKVSIVFEERNLSNNEVVRAENSDEFLFVAGLSDGFSNFGFLKFNRMPERVTVSEYKFLNFLVPDGEHKLLIYRNGISYSEEVLLPSDGHIMTKKLIFDSFAQGDKIEVSVKAGVIESDKLTFFIFPEGKYSNHIIWEDEFVLKSSMEFTGTFSIKSEFSFISVNTYQELVQHLEYLDSTKVAKITINTGWILKSQIDTIESLMRSKNVWIDLKGKMVSLRPISTNILNEDSERELIDFTIEFQINSKTNEETYSF